MKPPFSETLFYKILNIVFHFIVFILLTVITQIGGVVYVASLLACRKFAKYKKNKQVIVFVLLYLISAFLIVPYTAPFFGRERVWESEYIKGQSWFYKLANRNYVRPELNHVLKDVSEEFRVEHEGMKLVVLDANFPFINKFPLLPHLSHNDGKKVDVSLIYENTDATLTNKKPSVSGYGVFEEPKPEEYNQVDVCKKEGYWQYDFPKYLTFGKTNKDIVFSERGTVDLVRIILKQPEVGKLFIEPHLKYRLHLDNKKIRYHGCRAVRHDDHIHFQLK
jgi:hypothetical protein